MSGGMLRRVAACLAALALSALTACGAQQASQYWTAEPFEAHLQEYLSYAGAPTSGDPGATFRGKVVFVDLRGRRILDEYSWELQNREKSLLALRPEDVGAVVLVRERSRQVGSYVGGGAALEVRSTLTVVDTASGEVIGKKTFRSGEPPEEAPLGADVAGALPWERIVAFLSEHAQR